MLERTRVVFWCLVSVGALCPQCRSHSSQHDTGMGTFSTLKGLACYCQRWNTWLCKNYQVPIRVYHVCWSISFFEAPFQICEREKSHNLVCKRVSKMWMWTRLCSIHLPVLAPYLSLNWGKLSDRLWVEITVAILNGVFTAVFFQIKFEKLLDPKYTYYTYPSIYWNW